MKPVKGQSGPVCVVIAPLGKPAPIAEFLNTFVAKPDFSILVLDRDGKDHTPLEPTELAANTALPVTIFQSGSDLKRGSVLVVPGKTQLDVTDGRWRINGGAAALVANVDTLAHAFGAATAAVVFAPGDAEAMLALEAVAAQGGLPLVVQSGDVPNGAAPPALGDICTSSAQVAEMLAHHARLNTTAQSGVAALSEQDLQQVCAALRDAGGHDFSTYKATTLTRRILRRINVLQCASVADYTTLLHRNADEARTLTMDLLISVTSFFRDKEAFDALQKSALAKLITAEGTDPVRIWIAGCASGQEAYSIAMLAHETAEACGSTQPLQIFATDMSERALTTARKGLYPATIADEVSPERLARFFRRSGTHWQITKTLRQMIVFSPHNLIGDPPLSRMDLISCRNVLIYLDAPQQRKLMGVFHYALRENGYLFLGSSEAVSGHADLFRVVDARNRLAQKRATDTHAHFGLKGSGSLATGWQTPPSHRTTDLGNLSERVMLDNFTPPYAIANEDAQILYLSAGTEAYLQPPTGRYVNNILRMTRIEVRPTLRTSWTKALRSKRAVSHNAAFSHNGKRSELRITVQPLPDPGQGEDNYLVVFQPMAVSRPEPEPSGAQRPENEGIIDQLETEALRIREELERVVQDFEAANEELKSSNEELLSMNEELQASNEELEAKKAEIELSATTIERANADLVNLLASTEIPTIFLDEQRRIRSFTPTSADLYNLAPRDEGRPLAHFSHNFRQMDPIPDSATLIAGGGFHRSHAVHNDGRIFLRQITPYRLGTAVDGCVMSFVDISELETYRAESAKRLNDIETIYRYAPVGLAQLTPDLVYLRINDMLAEVNGIPAAETIGKSIGDIVPDLQKQAQAIVAEVLRSKRTVGPLDMRGSTRSDKGQDRIWSQHWSPILAADGTVESILVSVSDVTDREKQALEIRDSAKRLRKTMDAVLMFVGILSPEGVLLEANEPAIKAAGVDRSELIGKPFADCVWWADDAPRQKRLTDAIGMAAKGRSVRYDADISVGDGKRITIDFQISPYFDDGGEVIYLVPSGIDITARNEIEQSRRRTLNSLELAMKVGKLGAFDWDIATSRIEWTEQHYLICGYDMGEVRPSYAVWRDRVHPDDVERVEAAIDKARRTAKPFSSTYRLLHPDGRIVHVEAMGLFFYDDSGPSRMIGVMKDVSELKASEDRFRQMMAISQVGIVLSQRDGTITMANDAALGLLGYTTAAQRRKMNWKRHIHAANLRDARRMTLALFRNGRVEPMEFGLRTRSGDTQPVLLSAARISTSKDEFVSFIVDLSEQKRSEAHRNLLIEELNHRVKNTLATIQAMAAQTLRNTQSPEEFQKAFTGRLQAIATAHAILTKAETGQVDLVELIHRQVGPYAAVDGDHIRLSGATVQLSPDNAHALGLVLHELATNAAKYGALSCPDGVIDISWKILDKNIKLRWQESGGPLVAPPTRKGFGTRLIETSLSHAMGGSAVLEYDPDGLLGLFVISLEAHHA